MTKPRRAPIRAKHFFSSLLRRPPHFSRQFSVAPAHRRGEPRFRNTALAATLFTLAACGGGGGGTFVAGIIGARRNSAATHGVAFQSTILALRADTPGSCATSCTFSSTDVAAAIDFAVANVARVINLSLGGASSAIINTALTNAAAAGVIFVAAAGNEGDPNPIFPAQFAANAAALGLGIAAGASDVGNGIAGFSNRPAIQPPRSWWRRGSPSCRQTSAVAQGPGAARPSRHRTSAGPSPSCCNDSRA